MKDVGDLLLSAVVSRHHDEQLCSLCDGWGTEDGGHDDYGDELGHAVEEGVEEGVDVDYNAVVD